MLSLYWPHDIKRQAKLVVTLIAEIVADTPRRAIIRIVPCIGNSRPGLIRHTITEMLIREIHQDNKTTPITNV